MATVPKAVLLDISGRKALDLHPGPNDVSRLAPGVYFIREHPVVSSQHPGPTAASGERLAIHEVVITR